MKKLTHFYNTCDRYVHVTNVTATHAKVIRNWWIFSLNIGEKFNWYRILLNLARELKLEGKERDRRVEKRKRERVRGRKEGEEEVWEHDRFCALQSFSAWSSLCKFYLVTHSRLIVLTDTRMILVICCSSHFVCGSESPCCLVCHSAPCNWFSACHHYNLKRENIGHGPILVVVQAPTEKKLIVVTVVLQQYFSPCEYFVNYFLKNPMCRETEEEEETRARIGVRTPSSSWND